MQLHSVHTNVQKHQNKIEVFHWHTCMYTTINFLGKRGVKTNLSNFGTPYLTVLSEE